MYLCSDEDAGVRLDSDEPTKKPYIMGLDDGTLEELKLVLSEQRPPPASSLYDAELTLWHMYFCLS